MGEEEQIKLKKRERKVGGKKRVTFKKQKVIISSKEKGKKHKDMNHRQRN